MPFQEAPCVELGSGPQTPSVVPSPSPSEISTASSPEPQPIRATPLFRALAMPPPEPDQPRGQDELERRLPGYQRIVIPRELNLIELLKQSSGVTTDDEVLQIREARLRVVAEKVGLRRLNVLAPRLRSLNLDGSALASLRDLGIGLVHLKVLSVNRCGLNSLDGVWGLGALRELSAAGNRLQDLQPLAALQKLHTLNLSENPISDTTRLWTLGICGSLRRLTLTGTAAANLPHYRSQVAAALPMLVYLDDCPLHTDVNYDSDGLFGVAYSSDSADSDEEVVVPTLAIERPPAEPEPGSSHDIQWDPSTQCPEDNGDGNLGDIRVRRRRPATTECGGVRPSRPHVPLRPRTAMERPRTAMNAPTKLHIMNTLMDEEWRCSGSDLTSQSAVCGNLARALRKPSSFRRQVADAEKEMIEQTLENASRALAAEIPRAPKPEDWIKFKQETGIEIDIDFNQRPQSDPAKAIERLEMIERETLERFKQGEDLQSQAPKMASANFASIMSDFETWKLENASVDDFATNCDFTLFNDINLNPQLERQRLRSAVSDSSESRSD